MMSRSFLVTGLAATLSLGFAGEGASGEQSYQWALPKGFPAPRIPADNPMSEAKVGLGRFLFYDKRLSINGSQSCSSCHRQELAFTDGRAVAVGATGESHSRGAMSLVNVAYSQVLTWSDPTVVSLEKQVLIPLFSEHPIELGMRGREQSIVARLRMDEPYRALFPKAFPADKNPFTIANVARSIAAFERTIISASSPYDRYFLGHDPNAISESAVRGERVFYNETVGNCYRCHGGLNFNEMTGARGSTPDRVAFHNMGLYNLPGLFSYPPTGLGLYEHTKRRADVGKFKAPSLRNIALTGPYMHDGSIATLEEVVEHYAARGRRIASGPFAGNGADNPNKDALVNRIALTRQNKSDLVEFLRSLTDSDVIHDARFSDPW